MSALFQRKCKAYPFFQISSPLLQISRPCYFIHFHQIFKENARLTRCDVIKFSANFLQKCKATSPCDFIKFQPIFDIDARFNALVLWRPVTGQKTPFSMREKLFLNFSKIWLFIEISLWFHSRDFQGVEGQITLPPLIHIFTFHS